MAFTLASVTGLPFFRLGFLSGLSMLWHTPHCSNTSLPFAASPLSAAIADPAINRVAQAAESISVILIALGTPPGTNRLARFEPGLGTDFLQFTIVPSAPSSSCLLSRPL